MVLSDSEWTRLFLGVLPSTAGQAKRGSENENKQTHWPIGSLRIVWRIFAHTRTVCRQDTLLSRSALFEVGRPGVTHPNAPPEKLPAWGFVFLAPDLGFFYLCLAFCVRYTITLWIGCRYTVVSSSVCTELRVTK